ncbi:MAG: hypothetical protein ACFCVK_00945 [Acidimicrobiales bacterium]
MTDATPSSSDPGSVPAPAGEDRPSPPPGSARERLRTLYGHPGPYTSVYLSTDRELPGPQPDPTSRWAAMRPSLEADGATSAALDAIAARLPVPAPADAAAVAIIAAADGATIVDHGLDPLRYDLAIVDTLPYVAPLLEWEQRRLAHVVAVVGPDGADVVSFAAGRPDRSDEMAGRGAELALAIVDAVRVIDARLLVVAGEAEATRPLVDELRLRLPIGCRLVVEPDVGSADELADETVRQLADVAARETVGHLRDLRFLVAHGAAVDGVERTLAAVREGDADLVLLHDDPRDQRRVWIGDDPLLLSLEKGTGLDRQARLVDAIIRAAVLAGATVHVIPSTGSTGPDDDMAAVSTSFGEDGGTPLNWGR